MSASVYAKLVRGVEQLCRATPLYIRDGEASVVLARLPVARDALESLPAVAVCPAEQPERSEPFATGGYQSVTYVVQVVVIAASNRDASRGMADVLDARETLRKLFQRPSNIQAYAPEVLQADAAGEAPLARSAVFRGYDVSGFTARFRCIEST